MEMWVWILSIIGAVIAGAAIFLVYQEHKAFDEWMNDETHEDEWGV